MKGNKILNLILSACLPFLSKSVMANTPGDFFLKDSVLTKANFHDLNLDFEKVAAKFDAVNPVDYERHVFYLDPHVEDSKITISDVDGVMLRLPIDRVSYGSPRNEGHN
ncbi:MAG: hypothetical protein HQK50_07010 [Oligoflexia bacterium]|nr:hypothetical protein [Oligoflexia bacterium]MBF0365304.1 hypothetical protein [Oligoflexia bacterium]